MEGSGKADMRVGVGMGSRGVTARDSRGVTARLGGRGLYEASMLRATRVTRKNFPARFHLCQQISIFHRAHSAPFRRSSLAKASAKAPRTSALTHLDGHPVSADDDDLVRVNRPL